jgi:hypothetical protein
MPILGVFYGCPSSFFPFSTILCLKSSSPVFAIYKNDDFLRIIVLFFKNSLEFWAYLQ